MAINEILAWPITSFGVLTKRDFIKIHCSSIAALQYSGLVTVTPVETNVELVYDQGVADILLLVVRKT